MALDIGDVKRSAKTLMRECSPRPIVVAFVYFLVAILISYLGGRLNGSLYTINVDALMVGAPPREIITFTPENIRPLGSALDLLMRVVAQILSAGFTIYAFSVSRRIAAGYANLLDGFAIFLRVIWMQILTSVLVALWTMLLVIPGIIAAYSYRQAFYLMLDHPEWSCWRCIRESKALMRGHKWELFVFDLSFLGWSLLTVIFFPLLVFLVPFMEISCAEYYNRLIGVSVFTNRPDGGAAGEKPPWEY